ncbi:MAG: hypothetical protein N2378_07500 [Chloroflexaceae bacterium]|nr:hypothetical protein [Chloroflexaceae bacterium]
MPPTPAPPTPAGGQVTTAPPPQVTAPPAPSPPATAAPPTATPVPSPAAPPTATPVPSPAAAAGFVVFPDADGQLWRAGEPGQPSIKLGPASEPGVEPPWAASPDGRTIAIVAGTGVWPYSYQYQNPPALALWLAPSDGGSARKIQDLLPPRPLDLTPGSSDHFDLLTALTSPQALAWSPDGARVAFVSAHAGAPDLYTASLDGNVTRLTDDARIELQPAWSPDGRHIAYQAVSGLGTGAGYGDLGLAVVASSDGAPIFIRAPLPLANGANATFITGLVWISDTDFAVALARLPVCAAEIQVITPETGETTILLHSPDTCPGALAWSAGARTLAIVLGSVGREPAAGLYSWSPGESSARLVEAGAFSDLAWSPSGDTLAARSTQDDMRRSAYLIWRPDGSTRVVATRGEPIWSSDGRSLAVGELIVGPQGQVTGRLPQPEAQPIGWIGSDLVYVVPLIDAGDAAELHRWDGRSATLVARVRLSARRAIRIVEPVADPVKVSDRGVPA